MAHHLRVICCVLSILIVSAAKGQVVDSEKVFKEISPSVVSIESDESSGSGVVMSADGLVLTCLHVVNTPLKIRVKADVVKDGVPMELTFDDAQVVSAHAKYDLAYVQVKLLPGVTLTPIQQVQRATATGETCFAVGNPGGVGGASLTKTLTAGLVSSAKRTVEGLDYIQTSAAVNPGNSGGALCDKEGRLLGIIALKLGQSEGIGFAIPMFGLQQKDFAPLKERKGDSALANSYILQGNKAYREAMQLEGRNRQLALGAAYIYYRQAIAECPNEPAGYNNMGAIYTEVDEKSLAKAYFEKCIQMEPTFPNANLQLGFIYYDEGNRTRAMKCWLSGMRSTLTGPDHIEMRGACAENYGVIMKEDKRYAESAYATKWALSLVPKGPRAMRCQSVLQEVSGNLNDAQFKAIENKTDGFTTADMLKFVALRGSGPGAAASVAVAAVDVSALAAKIAKGAATPGAAGLTKALPEEPFDVRPACGGAYLVMHFKTMRQLGVFNVAHAKFDFYIPLKEENVSYTAGGDLLLLYQPEKREFEVWDLNKFECRATRTARLAGIVTDLEMALGNPNRCLIGYSDSTDELSRKRYALLDIGTFALRAIKTNYWATQGCYRDIEHMRWDDDGVCITRWATSHSPQGMELARMEKDDLSHVNYLHESLGPILPLTGGGRIYCMGEHAGVILDSKGNIVKKLKAGYLYPVRGADRYLAFVGDEAILTDAETGDEMRRFKMPFAIKLDAWTGNQLTDDRKVYANAWIDRICFVNPGQCNIVIFPLTGLGGAVGSSGAAGPGAALDGVKPGTTWRKKIELQPGSTVKVEMAPPGVSFDVASSSVVWQIPANQKPGKALILLNVTTPKGDRYERVEVTVGSAR